MSNLRKEILQIVHQNNDIGLHDVQTLTTKVNAKLNDLNYDEKEILKELNALFDEKYLDKVVMTFTEGESNGYEALDLTEKGRKYLEE